MKKKGTFLLLAASILLLNACSKIVGEGPVVSETRNTGSFSGIAVSISGDVNYQQGPVQSITIQAQRSILEVLETKIEGNDLVLKYKYNVRIGSHDRITVNITSPNLNSLTLSGSGNIRTTGSVQSNTFKMNISGSGNINMASLNTTSLDSRISGSGDIVVNQGTLNDETLRVSGSGSMNLMNVVAKDVTTTTSGSGSIKVNATETLHSTISGSGAVYYKGNPLITTSISGSGRMVPIQ